MAEEMTTISIKKTTRDQLLELVFARSNGYKRRETYDDVIQYLFTRRLISLREGE